MTFQQIHRNLVSSSNPYLTISSVIHRSERTAVTPMQRVFCVTYLYAWFLPQAICALTLFPSPHFEQKSNAFFFFHIFPGWLAPGSKNSSAKGLIGQILLHRNEESLSGINLSQVITFTQKASETTKIIKLGSIAHRMKCINVFSLEFSQALFKA